MRVGSLGTLLGESQTITAVNWIMAGLDSQAGLKGEMVREFEDLAKENWPALPNHCFDETDLAELIDFPVSDDWLRHYHFKGMTPRSPEPNVQAQMNEMSDRLERLETAIRTVSKAKTKPVYVATPTPSSRKTSRY